jgi:hypothetical protein
MRLVPSDPDIQTIVARIKSNDYDLQPDFQRGEVWGQAKQRRLIDSILRDWHIPPVHVIEQVNSTTTDVLDGQQRLVAIRDFVDGKFAIDGTSPPYDPEILALDGLRYSQLPPRWKKRFDQFTIRVFRIIDFKTDEPAELFYRLNQPVALTSAEQRNAFFGPVRTQVKSLVDELKTVDVGFSNSRMALDDVVARVCICIERRSIDEKITATLLSDRFRSTVAFPESTISACERGIRCLAESRSNWDYKPKFNKATLFSWLLVSSTISRFFESEASRILGDTISTVELLKIVIGDEFEASHTNATFLFELSIPPPHLAALGRLYFDRSSSRVSDASSVATRDIVIWIMLGSCLLPSDKSAASSIPQLVLLRSALPAFIDDKPSSVARLVDTLIASGKWGREP